MSFFWVALKVGLAWFCVLLAVFRPPLALVPKLARIMVLGMVICGPAGYFNTYWLEALAGLLAPGTREVVGSGVLSTALVWILVAPVEETLKYSIVRAAAGKRPGIEHPRDACLLAACSALGFATYENYFYMENVGYGVIHVRGWLCSMGHMLWSAVWGYYLGLAWLGRAPMKLAVLEGLALASVAHGIYNFLTGMVGPPFGLLIPVAAVIALGRLFQTRLYTGLHTPFLARRAADDDEAVRLAAAREAAGVFAPAAHEAARKLARDPVPAVRAAAEESLTKLAAELVRRARA
jgi:RsiW-degrading membrane proteinase PrsW (M82 family)